MVDNPDKTKAASSTAPRRFDVAVVGGGIVGTATARALSARPKTSVVVLEAEDRLAAHQTGRNSGVIHSGLYYKPGSLKARCCTTGRDALYRFCEEHDIPHERCGKLVVATHKEELPLLAELERRGRANRLEGIRRIGPEEIREREPHIDGIAGLLVPQTGIVDFPAVTRALAAIVNAQDGQIRLGAHVFAVTPEPGGLVLETRAGTVRARYMVNCGGLQSDRVARICGVDPGLRIVPFRGEYYELVAERRYLVRGLVYPVPDPRFPFLGVHFTRMIHGGVEAGPNAVLALSRNGYKRCSVSLRDVMSFALYGGFWRMVFKHWRAGLGELWRSLSKGASVKALRRMLPDLAKADLRPGNVGIRAQALESNGKLVDDFRIVEARRMIHVLNAPSPAATAALAIGETIAGMAQKHFELP